MRFLPLLLAVAACWTVDTDPGDLSFEIRRLETGEGSGSLLTVLDENGDGFPDLFVGGEESVVLLRGDGTGSFEIHEVVDAGESPADVAAGDFDRDGRLDLVVANHETRYVTLLFGGPDGFESGRRERLAIDVSPHPHAVAVADLDEDGNLDFVVDDRGGERLLVFGGSGDGAFEAGPPVPVGGNPYRGMTLRDIDGDGHLDVVTPNPAAVAVQLGDGTGSFRAGPHLPADDVRPFSVAVGDFDGDGLSDIAAGGGEGRRSVALWWGIGGGEFERARGSPHSVAEGPVTVAASDVDGDGVDDVLATSWAGSELSILRAREREVGITRIELDDHPWGVAAADLDGNGTMDVVTNHGSGVSLLLGHGRSER